MEPYIYLLVVILSSFYTRAEGDATVARVIGGPSPHIGRVEVYYADQWGGVCGTDNWDIDNAVVACRMIGYSSGRPIYRTTRYGRVTEPVWMAGVDCTGTENNIEDCSFDGWGQSGSCKTYTYPATVFCYNATGSNFDIRLTGGPGPHLGRVEVYYSGYWGTVCGQYDWDYSDASVTCKMLGYSYGQQLYPTNRYGSLFEPIWMGGVHCDGTEDSLADCSFGGWGQVAYCSTRPACVFCYDSTAGKDIQVRLSGGLGPHMGRVDVYYNGYWGTICDYQDWDFADANVTCRMLGYNIGRRIFQTHKYGDLIEPVWMANVQCDGTEDSLADCSFDGWGRFSRCGGFPASVFCYNVTYESEFNFRLGGGPGPYAGRVEVFYSGYWGSVCGLSGWDYRDAIVTCRMLGYSASHHPYITTRYGRITEPIWMAGVQCTGKEDSLADCAFDGWGQADQCGSIAASVFCYNVTEDSAIDIRLVDGSNSSTGYVEVYYSGHWGGVCSKDIDDHIFEDEGNGTFGDEDAAVACRMLNYREGYTLPEVYAHPSTVLWMDNVRCDGTESSLADCPFDGWGNVEDCFHQAYITCYNIVSGQPVTNVSIITNSTREGRENSTVDLTCHVSGGVPIPSLKWTCPPSVSASTPYTSRHGDSHTSAITVTLTRQANGQRCNCTGSQTNSSWTGSDQTHVFGVQFGPDKISLTRNKVVVKDDTRTLTLTCTTEEYNKHVHITWYNGTTQIPNTADVTNTSGIYGGFISTQILQLSRDRYQDGNVIKCLVQNEDVSIKEISTSVLLDIRDVTTDNGPSIGVIAGGVIGSCLALTAIVAIAAFLICRRRHFRKGTHDSTTNDDNSPSTNHKLELTNTSPPSVYSGLKGQEGLQIFTSGRSDYQNVENSGSSPQYVNAHIAENTVMGSQSLPSESTYEALGERPVASVYASLSRSSRCTDHQYVNTSTQ